jgi:hypothetical protein
VTALRSVSLSQLAPDELVRAEDVGRFIGCSARTVQRAGIPYVDVRPRVRRYRVQDVREWIASRVRAA